MRRYFQNIINKNPAAVGFFAFLTLAFLWLYSLQLVSRLIFILHRSEHAASVKLFLNASISGFPLDVAMLVYLLILFLLLYALAVFLRKPKLLHLIWIPAIPAILMAFVTAFADAEMYRAWGTKFNTQARQYLQHPSEALASASEAHLFTIILVTTLLTAGWIWFLYRMIRKIQGGKQTFRRLMALPAVMAAVCAAPLVRGGLQTIPISQSSVYFSSDPFENLAAVNSSWNLLYYWVNELPEVDPEKYRFQPGDDMDPSEWFRGNNISAIETREKPNVVMIILESFSSYTSGYFGGAFHATPNLDTLANGGRAYVNAYSQGDRTDKGLAAILSGWPGLGTHSILFEPSKAAKLPSLARLASQKGYSTSFYYGGDMSFANMTAYLRNAGFERLRDESAWDDRSKGSKWGVHDEFVFRELLKDLRTQRQPFFSVMLTLSSHEPYDVPGTDMKKLKTENERFLHSVSYTDRCLGKFMAEAARQPWFKNTVFVFVADHGRNLGLQNMGYIQPGHYRVPIVFYGALPPEFAAGRDTGFVNQCDIAETVALRFFNTGGGHFPWSRDLGSKQSNFSYYTFNNGFGIVSPEGYVVWNNNPPGVLEKQGRGEVWLKKGQALQYHLARDHKNF